MTIYRTLLAALAAVVVGALGAAAAQSLPGPFADSLPGSLPGTPPYRVIAKDGFGSADNDYAWSMAWFKGKLYVGTARSEECVEGATEVFYNPTDPSQYSTTPVPGATCPANEYDIDLQAQIWQYTPETKAWRMVFNSPQNIPNPRAPGKFVARDLGFRGMVVDNGKLYVGDVTPDEYIPELAGSEPPRILVTSNGTNFTAFDAPSTIHTFLGVQKPIGFRAMTTYDGHMYVTASSGLTGDGVILRVNNPGSASPTFTQISPPSFQTFELQVFNGHLYAGNGSSANTGYTVYRTNAESDTPAWTPVVTGGAGMGGNITSVVSMGVYRNQLYVGASGWYNTLFPASELIAISPNDRWDLVAGTPRRINGVMRYPISGLGNGFGNPFNAHFWRMDVFDGGLYIGTNDWSYTLQQTPGASAQLQNQFGFDIWGTCNGRYWSPVTENAFGSGIDNFGARTLVATPFGNFIGSANHSQGTTIYQSGPGAATCDGQQSTTGSSAAGASAGPHAAVAASAPAAPAPPGQLLTDVQTCGTVVSWRRTPGAVRYEVLRSTARTFEVPGPKRLLLAGGAVPDVPPHGSSGEGAMTIDGSPTVIATTSGLDYVDRGAPAGSQYEVIAESAGSQSSAPSNVAAAPSLLPPATFSTVRAALRPAASGLASSASVGSAGLLHEAQVRWFSGDRAGAITALAQLQRTLDTTATASRAGDVGPQADLQDAVSRLARKLQYAGLACRAG